MDLTRLYNLTTPELRSEAERLGVTDTYAMSRGQLIHAIRNEVEGPPAEGFFGKVLGFAKWALAAAEGVEPDREPDPGPDPDPDPVPDRVPDPVPDPDPVPESESGSASASESVTGNENGNENGNGNENENGNQSGNVTVPPPPSAVVQDRVAVAVAAPAPAPERSEASGPPSRPPAGVFSKGARVFEEPFPTRTMARILAEQGHFKRSLAIYDTLLREEPADVELSAEVENVRARSRARRPHA